MIKFSSQSYIIIMNQYLSYNKEDLDLLRKCIKVQRRSKSKDHSRSKSLKVTQIKDQSMHKTKRVGKILGMENYDELSTKKKIGQCESKQHNERVSQFVIQQQKSEQSQIHVPSNFKQKTVCNEADKKASIAGANIQQRIEELRERLNYRLYINYCQLMKQPLYGKYIDTKFRPKQE